MSDNGTTIGLVIFVVVVVFALLVITVAIINDTNNNEKKEQQKQEQLKKEEQFNKILQQREINQKIKILRLKLDIIKNQQLTKKRDLQIKKLENELRDLEK